MIVLSLRLFPRGTCREWQWFGYLDTQCVLVSNDFCLERLSVAPRVGMGNGAFQVLLLLRIFLSQISRKGEGDYGALMGSRIATRRTQLS